jgi:hypothetical protein
VRLTQQSRIISSFTGRRGASDNRESEGENLKDTPFQFYSFMGLFIITATLLILLIGHMIWTYWIKPKL